MSNLPSATLRVNVTHNPLAFIYELFTPTVTINGVRHQRPWGQHTFQVAPGPCEVSVSYPWIFAPECGRNTVRFEIDASQARTVTYRAGLIRFLPGSIRVE